MAPFAAPPSLLSLALLVLLGSLLVGLPATAGLDIFNPGWTAGQATFYPDAAKGTGHALSATLKYKLTGSTYLGQINKQTLVSCVSLQGQCFEGFWLRDRNGCHLSEAF